MLVVVWFGIQRSGIEDTPDRRLSLSVSSVDMSRFLRDLLIAVQNRGDSVVVVPTK